MAKFLKLDRDGYVLGPYVIDVSNVNLAFVSELASTTTNIKLTYRYVQNVETPVTIKINGGVTEAQQVIDAVYDAKSSSLTNNIFEIPNAPTIVSIIY